ncbi:MAG: acetamidase [Chloroflexi bacterium]|nr:acetamidase [Chloroflexota bacterium]
MTHHRFAPTRFHNAIGSHEPVLRIASGDSVSTWCVDARGRDSHDVEITARGNPQTGPFYIEGAAPGDTIAVHLDRMRPNRPRGWSNSVIAPWIVDAGFVHSMPRGKLDEWDVDATAGTATLRVPSPGLQSLRPLPIDPMLGCFGVAPPGGQAISTATSSTHGGNMDYRGFREGVTVYFPVFVEGALFHLGDGHAVQGDGEIVGTGIEISFDVTFTVRLIKDWATNWPRAENATDIMTVGNARPLDQCVQHATTEMLIWLHEDFGLDSEDASRLLGQCIRYDLGNIFDPAYTMVARVAKSLLPTRMAR